MRWKGLINTVQYMQCPEAVDALFLTPITRVTSLTDRRVCPFRTEIKTETQTLLYYLIGPANRLKGRNQSINQSINTGV